MQRISTTGLARCAAVLTSILGATPAMADTYPSTPDSDTAWPIVELRQYTLHPGQRDVLIDVFEQHFIEGQEVMEMRLIGQFRDRDNPDRFVWIRAFRDMPSRAEALQKFYTGPVWQEHRQVANATMIDSDNVLLLHRAGRTSNFPTVATLAPKGAKGAGRGIVTAEIYYFERGREREFVTYFDREIRPLLDVAEIPVVAALVSETSANTFPRLPVRDKDFVFVWFSRFSDDARRAERFRRLQRAPRWLEVEKQLSGWFKRPAESLRLEPTARSRLHG